MHVQSVHSYYFWPQDMQICDVFVVVAVAVAKEGAFETRTTTAKRTSF